GQLYAAADIDRSKFGTGVGRPQPSPDHGQGEQAASCGQAFQLEGQKQEESGRAKCRHEWRPSRSWELEHVLRACLNGACHNGGAPAGWSVGQVVASRFDVGAQVGLIPMRLAAIYERDAA